MHLTTEPATPETKADKIEGIFPDMVIHIWELATGRIILQGQSSLKIRPHFNKKKPGWGGTFYNPSCKRCISRMIIFQAGPGKNEKLYPKNN
jgi:hypothetical protein